MQTGGRSHTGVRAVLGITGVNFDFVRSDAERFEVMAGMQDAACVAALTLVFPGTEVGYGTVRIQFQSNFSEVSSTTGAGETADGNANCSSSSQEWIQQLLSCTFLRRSDGLSS